MKQTLGLEDSRSVSWFKKRLGLSACGLALSSRGEELSLIILLSKPGRFSSVQVDRTH